MSERRQVGRPRISRGVNGRRVGRPVGQSRQTLSGRAENSRRRQARIRQAIAENSEVSQEFNEVGERVVRETLQYSVGLMAVSSVPPDDVKSDIGGLRERCVHCAGLHFRCERVRGHFSSCCQDGKVLLPETHFPEFLKELATGGSHEAKVYREFIRNINSSFSFVSFGANIRQPAGQGPFCFRVCGDIFHFAGSLYPEEGNEPVAAQLYIIDVDEATNIRRRRGLTQFSGHVLARIATYLLEHNPYAMAYRMMHEVMKEEERQSEAIGQPIRNYYLSFIHEPNEDLRRFNNPLTNEVAAIFQTSDGGPPSTREFRVYPRNQPTFRINHDSMHCDPMTYPLIWPRGETGWHIAMKHNGVRRTPIRDSLTMREYICFKMTVRGEGPSGDFNPVLNSGRLTQQLIVDYYCRIEGDRLKFIRNQQKRLRADTYMGLSDAINRRAEAEGLRTGRMVILPSTFSGSPRNMMQNYQDAMAIVRKFGKPDYLITMTCNPAWPEITTSIQRYDRPENRPDIVVRVFHAKVQELCNLLRTSQIFGSVKTLIYTIEFQKRGLPHVHLLLGVHERFKLREIEDIDGVISAEIPDESQDTVLFDLVSRHMMHGPCGLLNPLSVCMRDGVCTKGFPKEFQDVTKENQRGYPLYMRRDNGRAITKTVNRAHVELNNSYVVPYNPFLIKYFRAHINVELCSSVQSVKYIYKYIYKGHDCANIEIRADGTQQISNDEVTTYINTRYVGPTEAAWRILSYRMHEQNYSIERLPVHLENQQTIVFSEDNIEAAYMEAQYRRTKLTAWFEFNRVSDQQILYPEIPQHCVWRNNRWQTRLRGNDNVIGRMYTVNIVDQERYFLRLLLLNITGAKSFEDMRTFQGIVHQTYKEAAFARGLIMDDSEWDRCLNEASLSSFPRELRSLFAYILVFQSPTNALSLFEKYSFQLSEDFQRTMPPEEATVHALREISVVLANHGFSLENFNLPSIQAGYLLRQHFEGTEIDIQGCMDESEQMYGSMNVEQRYIVDEIELAVNRSYNNCCNAFFIDGPGGTGKTFIYRYLIDKLFASRRIVISVAWTGIAAMLLKGGRTVHSRFKMPLKLNEDSVCALSANSREAGHIKSAALIIWDEAPMASCFALNCIDRFLRDIMNNDVPFGGKVIVLGGDFRQVLPVVPHGSRHSIVRQTLKSSNIWHLVRKFTLTINMRAEDDEEFRSFLLDIGNGTYPTIDGGDMIALPENIVLSSEDDLVREVYGQDVPISPDVIRSSAILCPKNSHCSTINDSIIAMLPGDVRTYYSINRVVDENNDANNYPVEFLNTLEFSGLPPHTLTLKQNAVVILMRNLNTAEGLMNGTRLIVERMLDNCLDLKVLTGASSGKRVLLPRIDLTPSDSTLPFTLKRRQFPVKLAFAITINKAQGQTLENIGLYLPEPVFGHGQLYVALSRARGFRNVKVKIESSDSTVQKETRTRNVVYREILS